MAPPPLARQGFSLQDVTDISEKSRDTVLEKIKGARLGPIFTPPHIQDTVFLPSEIGGQPWSGGSFDPESRIFYVGSNDLPAIRTLTKNSDKNSPIAYVGGTSAHGHDWIQALVDQDGYPGIRPPWGSLIAVSLDTGKFVWRVPLGEYPELTARGIAPTGMPNLGGNIVTKGGLVFIGATKDEMFRAFDKLTGRIVWSYKLPAGEASERKQRDQNPTERERPPCRLRSLRQRCGKRTAVCASSSKTEALGTTLCQAS